MNKRVIVTGATGFVGSYLTEELLRHQYEVYAVVRNAEKVHNFVKNPGFHVIEKDLEHFTISDLPDVSFDTFFHLGWAGVNREEINDDVVHACSLHNSVKCLEIARKTGCRCFIDSGSKAEYGAQDKVQKEDAVCRPESAYGKAKLEFYQKAYSYCKANNIRYYHARLFSVIGVGDHPWSLISTACRNFTKHEELKLGPCTQLWNFTAVEDVARALRMMCECAAETEADNGIYNIAGDDTRILKAFVEEIHKICHSRSEIVYGKGNANNDFMNPDNDKIRKLTGWSEEFRFAESIRRIIEDNGKK